MSLAQRVRRLEALELEHCLYEEAERLAKESGGDVEDLRAIADRIMRYGMDAEIRLMAREFGKTEDEVRAEMEAIREGDKPS